MDLQKREGECVVVGAEQSDIAGVGILIGFIGQASISLLLAGWVFFFSNAGYLELHEDENSIEHAIGRKRLESVSDILMIGNDIQMLLGISYMLSVLTSAGSIDTYHLHLVFDIVSFVGVSNAAALVCWHFCDAKLTKKTKWQKGLQHLTSRYRVTYIFAAGFLALVILLCIRLGEWNLNHHPGRCYHSEYLTAPSASHPTADIIYVAITAAWLLIVTALTLLVGHRRRRTVLILAFLQFPVHLYMAIALRTVNQGKLYGESTTENLWDFGQTTSVVLLVLAIGEFIRKSMVFVRFERELRASGSAMGIHHHKSSERSSRVDGAEENPDDVRRRVEQAERRTSTRGLWV